MAKNKQTMNIYIASEAEALSASGRDSCVSIISSRDGMHTAEFRRPFTTVQQVGNMTVEVTVKVKKAKT